MREPIYYYFRFRIALLCIALMTVVSIASHFRTIEFRDKYEYMITENVKLYKQLRECNEDLDMTIDLYTSRGNTAIMDYYCDRWKRYQESRIERLNEEELMP